MIGEAQDIEKKAKTINRYPMAILVMVVTALLTTFVNQLFKTSDGRTDDCKSQIATLNARVEKLETTLDEYTRTVLFKEDQIKVQAGIIKDLQKGDSNHE